MRIYEIDDPATQDLIPKQQTTNLGKQQPQVKPAKPVAQPVQQTTEPVYADGKQTKAMALNIQSVLQSAQLPGKASSEVSRLDKTPMIRVLNSAPREEHFAAINQAGYALRRADSKTINVSGTYQAYTYNFTVDNVIYTIVLAAKGKSTADGGGAQLSKQQLRPDKLGLAGREFTRGSLEKAAKAAISSSVRDVQTQEALIQLIDVAVKKRKVIDPELLSYIDDVVTLISQDFGEVLAPLMMAKNANYVITFPTESNAMLIDAEVDGQPVAVKSLGGSGNSFTAIKDLINKYNAAEQAANRPIPEIVSLINEFISGDSTVNNIIRVAQRAKLPEAQALNQLLQATPQSFKELTDAVAKLQKKLLKKTPPEGLYKAYIGAILPVAQAGNWIKNPKNPKPTALGMPSDWRKYADDSVDNAQDEKPTKNTGKKAFDKDFVLYASKQITYMLGAAFDKEMKTGVRAIEMGNAISKIMSAKNAAGVRIEITPAGGLQLTQTPFSAAKWSFHYHAATDAPDRNAPGFLLQFS